jgi:hypothetical protein
MKQDRDLKPALPVAALHNMKKHRSVRIVIVDD